MFDTEDAVDALCAAIGPDERPVWTVFDRPDGDPDGFELIPGPGALLGWQAPPEVWAIGIAAGATATIQDDHAGRRRCQVACVVDRSGATSGRVRFPPTGQGEEREAHYEAPQDGRMLDVLRRCLGLATAPPTESVACVLALRWLVAVAAEARRRCQRLHWDAAIRLHPAVALLGGPDFTRYDERVGFSSRHGRGRPGDPLASVVQVATGAWDWTEVRARCVERRVGIGDVSAELMAWMDDGMVARWLCERIEGIDEIIDAGVAAVHEDDLAGVERLLLAALGAPPPAADDHTG